MEIQKGLYKVIHKQELCSVLVVMFFMCGLIPAILCAEQKQILHDDLFSVSFPNEKDGWTCGRFGTILHTANGGKTWTRQNSGTDYTLSSVCFVDGQNGWAVGDQGIIIHTVDGGKTWEMQKSPVPYVLMNVYFISPLKGWIVGERTHILSTQNGGKTWRVQFSDEDFILKAASFCDELHGWAVGEYGYIYHTTNGGATWEKQAGYLRISPETLQPEGGKFLFDVMALDPQIVWAVGIDGTVIRTVDRGKTWKKVATGAPKTQLFCIASNKKETILIGGNGVFLRSMNKGGTWEVPEFRPPITYDWIYKVARRGDSGFVAVGSKGAIYVSSSTFWQRVFY
jgi:photosystem II stability/assembly factor-like uncharacterized protein